LYESNTDPNTTPIDEVVAVTRNAELLDQCEAFLREYYRDEVHELARQYPRDQRSLYVDWHDLLAANPDLADDALTNPRDITDHFEEALRQFDLPIDVSLGRAHVRFYNLNEEDTYEIGAYSPARVQGTRLAIDAQVVRVGDVLPKPERMVFVCQRCGHETEVPQNGPGVQEPYQCESCERQGPFKADDDRSDFVDAQLVRLQQTPAQADGGTGRSIDVRIEDDLTNAVSPGDRVTVTGILEFERDGGDSYPEPYLSGEAVEHQESDYEEIEISAADEQRIEALAGGAEGDPVELLVEELATSIRGHETIKEALILQAFGGVRVTHADGTSTRGESHVLLLGDPSTAKSSLLRTVANLTPRSVYASGKGASAAGMTAAADRTDFGQGEQWVVEGGALVKAHKGTACVDEIDKVQEDAVSSMHDVLSSGEVHVNKASINATLHAHTSLLAAGNPKYGRFDPYKSIKDQVELGPTLLSRFDLIFLVRDEPDEHEDKLTGRHILESKEQAKQQPTHGSEEDESGLGQDLIRKWIAYAKQQPSPEFASEAVREHANDAFAEFRGVNGYDPDDPVPVTFRKLEGIHRLAEASAKVRLSDTIEKRDVDRALALVGESLRQFGKGEDGEYDADVVEANATSSQRDRITSVRSIIEELQAEVDGGVPLEDVVEVCSEEAGLSAERVEETVERLLDEGEAYRPAKGEQDGVRVI
jgi:replicative DNA helicase Mcm